MSTNPTSDPAAKGIDEPLIRIRDLNVYYGQEHTLKNINLDIPKNQITVIIGPSGCGKSTLLKTLNRFLELTPDTHLTGQVVVDGVDIYSPNVDVTEVRKRVGLLLQKPFPLPMSIYDSVAYGIRIHRMQRHRDLNMLVQHNLEMAGLWDEVKNRLHAPASSLSLGQQQRLCLARGLAVEPEILLGDEPTSALDPISAQHIEGRLAKLKNSYTVVLVTHILRQAKRLADHIVFIYLGEIIESGPTHEVLEHPRQSRTQAYLEGALS